MEGLPVEALEQSVFRAEMPTVSVPTPSEIAHFRRLEEHATTSVKPSVSERRLPGRPNNEDVRRRGEYLEEGEVAKIRQAAAKLGRHGHHDATLILVTYRHALRVSELTSLRWE